MGIKVGIVGMGFIGVSHVDALRRIGFVELVAVADINHDLARKKAEDYSIPKCYATMEELINDPEIDVVHNCTPTHLHSQVNEMIIRSGKHVFSEKPLARTSGESAHVMELLKEYPDTVAGINFCYRMNPLVQDAKNRIASGEIGRPYLIHGSYLQDWLLFDTDYNWRVETEYSGPSRCVGDIGSHWMDIAQVLAGSRIVEVCADTAIIHPTRKKPTTQTETFAKSENLEYQEVAVETEDYAGVLIKFENGIRGAFQCSQVSAGRKCYIDIEVDASLASYHWNHEIGDRMWKGNRDQNNELIIRNPNLMTDKARQYTYLAAGHPEGWNDAFTNELAAFYRFIQRGGKPGVDTCDFATFEDGHYIMKLTEAIIKSGQERRWVTVE